MTEKALAPLLEEFKALPESDRKPKLPNPEEATPAKREVPSPPENGLIIRGYCTYVDAEGNAPEKTRYYYYEHNPDAWAAETQSDMLWLTEEEWRSLIPAELKLGSEVEVSAGIQRRFYSTIGIDYMEGSVNALPVRESNMNISYTGDKKGDVVILWVTGTGKMGKPLNDASSDGPKTRGCELKVQGRIEYNTKKKQIVGFDIAGLGKAWGNKMEYVRREIGIKEYPWNYGIACELVTGTTPYDLIPPYNMLHYGGGMKYFAEK